jgi:hypothetical protein
LQGEFGEFYKFCECRQIQSQDFILKNQQKLVPKKSYHVELDYHRQIDPLINQQSFDNHESMFPKKNLAKREFTVVGPGPSTLNSSIEVLLRFLGRDY